jgi:hypothetical protein
MMSVWREIVSVVSGRQLESRAAQPHLRDVGSERATDSMSSG